MTEQIIAQLTDIVGSTGMVLGADSRSRPNFSLGLGECQALAIVRPKTTEELSRVMALCYAENRPMVALGGLTGLVNGIVCNAGDIGISTERINQIESFDADAGVITVQAGCVLQTVQTHAANQGWLFALDYGSRGTATIGGAVSTNAGGNSVIRYGMARQQILGLEVVMADGTVVSSMNEMLKNNAAYDLKQLFIGSEGTLGIVTRVVIRLFPLPTTVQTAFVAVNSFGALTSVLKDLGRSLEGKLSAFEVMWQNHYTLLVDTLKKHPAFLPSNYPYYILIESSGNDEEREQQLFTQVLAQLMEQGVVADAVISQSGQQTTQLWQMRDDIEALLNAMAPTITYDVSTPLRHMEAYVDEVYERLAQDCPDVSNVTFGHLGDGNIHFFAGPGHNKEAINNAVYEPLVKYGGSISAEHGIGLDKKSYLPLSRSNAEIALMRTVKAALDPKNLLNPGKVI